MLQVYNVTLHPRQTDDTTLWLEKNKNKNKANSTEAFNSVVLPLS